MTWQTGEADIRQLLGARHLQQVTPDRGSANDLVNQARQHIASARLIVDSDPEGAFQLAYDGARKAFAAILESQGLRGTTQGGHIAIADAIRAQLGSVLRGELDDFGWMRRTRNQTEYRTDRGPGAHADDAADAIAMASAIIEIPDRVMDQLGIFT